MIGRRGLRFTPAGFAVVFLVVGGFQVWGRSGSPWLWLIVVTLVLAFVLDGVLSWLALRAPRLTIGGPADGMVGRTSPLRVTVEKPVGRLRLRMVSVTGAPWVRVDAPAHGDLPVTPQVRGVFPGAVFELATAAPLGLVSVNRPLYVHLPEPIHVAPSPTPGVRLPLGRELVEGVRPDRQPGGDLPRGARPYQPGDPRRSVHWGASAHHGELMVRTTESLHRSTVVVVVDLGPEPGPQAEAVASCGLGTVLDALDRHGAAVLVTREQEGLVRATVPDRVGAGRRLALAVPGPPMAPGPDDVVVDAATMAQRVPADEHRAPSVEAPT